MPSQTHDTARARTGTAPRERPTTVSTPAPAAALKRPVTETMPDVRSVTIDGSTGIYTVTDRWEGNFDPMSLTVESPGPIVVYFSVGSGGFVNPPVSDYACPAQGMITRPVAATDLVLGVEPSVLEENQAVIIIIRWRTLQPAYLASV